VPGKRGGQCWGKSGAGATPHIRVAAAAGRSRPCPWRPPLSSGRRIVEKLDARGQTLFDPLFLSITDQKVDIVRIAEVLLLDLPLTLEEPCVGVLDASHGLQQVTADGGTDVLNQ
jgi:hypothetical protein